MKSAVLFPFILMCFVAANVFGQVDAYERLNPSKMWSRKDKIAILAEAEKFAKADLESKNSIKSLIEENNDLRRALKLNTWDEPMPVAIQAYAYTRLIPRGLWYKGEKNAIIAETKGFAEAGIENENEIKRLQKENDVFGLNIQIIN